MTLKSILTIIVFTILTVRCFGTTWFAAYPYTQQVKGQDIVIKAFPYDPHSSSPMIGSTRIYRRNKLLYSIDKYYRERIFTSNNGQYLVVVHTTNSRGLASYTSFGVERLNFNQTAIEVFKNGSPFRKFLLKDVIDTSKLSNDGRFYHWGYSVDFSSYKSAEIGCEVCNEIYGKRILRTGDTTEIYPDELEKCRNECDSVNLKETEMNILNKSIFVQNNSLFILTNQSTAVKLDLETLEIQKISFEELVPNKQLFSPPKINRKYKKIKYPDKFYEPNLKGGRSFEEGIADLFNLTISDNKDEESFCVFINYLVLNKEGECVEFYGSINDQRISEYFSEESINLEMTEKLNTWVKEQTFETKFIPKGFDRYSFLCIVNLR